MTREEVKEFLLSKCKILNTYSWSDDRKAYDVPKYVLSDSKTLKLIDQIYNYHEAQLKAKDKEIERLKAESKQSYIEGSKSCDDFIQHLHKQIEELSK